MPCPTCSHTMQCIGTLEGRTHYWCPRCGTLRAYRDGDLGAELVHDERPKVVEYLRGFHRMISDNDAGRALRELARLEGIPEAIFKPEDRPPTEGA